MNTIVVNDDSIKKKIIKELDAVFDIASMIEKDTEKRRLEIDIENSFVETLRNDIGQMILNDSRTRVCENTEVRGEKVNKIKTKKLIK